MWQHLRENKQTFQWYKIYCQQTLLQQRNNWPKTSFLTLCAKFTFRVLGSNLAFCRTALFWTESSDVVLGICRSHSSSFGVIAANAPDYWSQLIFGGHLLRLWVWHSLISALPLSIAHRASMMEHLSYLLKVFDLLTFRHLSHFFLCPVGHLGTLVVQYIFYSDFWWLHPFSSNHLASMKPFDHTGNVFWCYFQCLLILSWCGEAGWMSICC